MVFSVKTNDPKMQLHINPHQTFCLGESQTNLCVTWFFATPYPAVMSVDAAIYLDLTLIGKHNIMHKIVLIINFFLAYTQQTPFSLVCQQL